MIEITIGKEVKTFKTDKAALSYLQALREEIVSSPYHLAAKKVRLSEQVLDTFMRRGGRMRGQRYADKLRLEKRLQTDKEALAMIDPPEKIKVEINHLYVLPKINIKFKN